MSTDPPGGLCLQCWSLTLKTQQYTSKLTTLNKWVDYQYYRCEQFYDNLLVFPELVCDRPIPLADTVKLGFGIKLKITKKNNNTN